MIHTPVRAPQANAYADRFVRTVRTECLGWLLIVGHRHLEHVLRIYIQHAHLTRAIAINEGTAVENDILRCLTNVQDRVRWIVGVLTGYA